MEHTSSTYTALNKSALVTLISEKDSLIQKKDAELLEKKEEVRMLQRLLLQKEQAKYAPKTERLSQPHPILPLSFEEEPSPAPPVTDAEPLIVVEKHTRVARPGRKPLPGELPREQIEYTPTETTCSCCNAELKEIGREVTQELEKVPATLKVIEHIRIKKACPKCKNAGVLIAPLPPSVLPLERSRPGPGLISDIMVSKYVDHIPLNRQEKMYARAGIQLPRQRLCDWVHQTVDLLVPAYNALKEELLKKSYLQGDETTLKVQDGVKEGKCHVGFLWGFHGPPDIVWFHYAPGRAGHIPKEILQTFKGVLQTDAYAGYNPVFVPDEVKRLACLAHIRRKFIEIGQGPEVDCVLKTIAQLYKLDKLAKDDEARLLLRQNRLLPMVHTLYDYMDKALPRTLPRSPLAKALSYAIPQRLAVERIFSAAEYQLDNNSIEREMKHIAVGRKNYLFAGSHEGARSAAIIYSLFGTCKLRKVNPWTWLRSYLQKVHTHPQSKIIELLPGQYSISETSADSDKNLGVSGAHTAV